MKKIITLLVLAVALLHEACAADAPKPLTETQKAFIVSRFCSEVKYNFVHFDKLKFDWDSLCMARLPELCATVSDAEFVKGLSRMNAMLCDGHTFINTGRGWNEGEMANWEKPFPLTTRWIDGRVVVVDVWSHALKERGVVRGCEVVSIDGEDVVGFGERTIAPYVYSSTRQWAKYRTFSGYEVTKAPGRKVSSIVFRKADGKCVEVASSRNDLDWDLYADAAGSCFEYKLLDSNVGYLKVRNFLQGSFKKEEFDSIYNEILTTRALIIDLRDNGGGNSAYADYMMRHFVDTVVPRGVWRSPKYVAAHASWKMPKEWHTVNDDELRPVAGKAIFDRRICVLVSERTFSSAENFCALFRNAGRGKIVGVATGGSTGNPIIVDLGYGVKCGICTREEFLSDGTPFVGVGIVPDVEVKETVESFRAGRDVVLERALSVILGHD